MGKFPTRWYIAGFIIVLLIYVSSVAFNIPVVKLVADPMQTYGSKFYIGFLSNLNALTWAVGAHCTLFTWVLLKRLNGTAEWLRFFKLGGILTTILMFDDLFMFHERIFPHHLFLPSITGLRPNEKIPIALYGIFAIYFVYTCRHTILQKTPWKHLMLAIGFLASSVIIDRGVGKYILPDKAMHYLVEDGAEFLGAIGWSWYFVFVALDVLTQHKAVPADTVP